MKSVNPDIYDKNYYLNVCLGSEEFKKSKGKNIHARWQKLFKNIPITSSSRVLDVGCGRGDITLYFAQKAGEAVGIDYSKAAIAIAQDMKKHCKEPLKKKISFRLMNVKKLDFPDNYFDVIICVDVIEHLYKEEAEKAMKELSRVLKKDGILFVHTGANKLYYDMTYKWYVLPMNKLLTKADQLLKGIKYSSLPIDPRTLEEKEQHVNEPTYLYLKNLLRKFHFTGKIQTEIGSLKPEKTLRSHVYNFIVTLYPFSTIFPLNLFFGWVFFGSFRNNK